MTEGTENTHNAESKYTKCVVFLYMYATLNAAPPQAPPLHHHTQLLQRFPFSHLHSGFSLSLALHTSTHHPALHTPYICVKKKKSPTHQMLFHIVFKVKDLKPSCWPPNAFGNKLGVRGLKFCIFNQVYSLMHPIWSGNKVILFTAHKVPTWIHYSWF